MSSALCDGVRGALPPIPALIPITVLHPCGGTTQQSSPDNGDTTAVTNNNNNINKYKSGVNNNNNNTINRVGSVDDHCQNSNGSGDNIRSTYGCSVRTGDSAATSDHSTTTSGGGGCSGRQQRTRRSTQQTVHQHTTIDSSVQQESRDRSVNEQAPTRRSSRPERHRKSDRRRCGHRTDRQKCTTTCSSRSHSSSVRRKITTNHRASVKTNSPSTQTTTPHSNTSVATSTVPRVNPIFLWVKQEDTRIVEVRCEDYDKRNRIRLTKTAQGWRAIPRTETLLPASVTPVLSDLKSQSAPQPQQTEIVELKQKQKNKTKSRKSSKSKRKSIEHFCEDIDVDDNTDTPAGQHLQQPQQQQPQHPQQLRIGVDPEIEALTVTREETSSPAWSAPVNIESHLPSHTITIPRKKLLLDGPDSKVEEASTTSTSTSSISGSSSGGVVVGKHNNNSSEDASVGVRSAGDECCVNSADCSAPPPPSPPAQPASLDPNTVGSCDVTPLDNLLAVAEFEFNHQVHSESQQQQLQHRQQDEVDAIIELDSSSSEDHDDHEQQSSQVNDDVFETNHHHMLVAAHSTDNNISDKHDDEDDNAMETTHCYNDDEDDDDASIVETALTDLSEQHKEFFENIVQLNKLIESRTASENAAKISLPTDQSKDNKVAAASSERPVTSEDSADYNEDDENHLAMDDIITRLEQSLQSPEETTTAAASTVATTTNTCCTTTTTDEMEHDLCADATNFIPIANDDEASEKIEEINDKSNNEGDEDDDVTYINDDEEEAAAQLQQHDMKNEAAKLCENQCEVEEVDVDDDEDEEEEEVVAVDETSNTPKDEGSVVTQENKITSLEILDSTTTAFDEKSTVESIIDDDDEVDEQPTDLSTTNKQVMIVEEEEVADEFEDDEEVFEDNAEDLPTDLSIPKHVIPTPPLRVETPRPPSHSSETIQSPQPSGIPAVPPSPDIFFANSAQKNKSLFLETLLSSSSPKLCLTPEVTITRQQKEPLDLGKSRKSASPTVTCSEEVKNDNFKYNNNEGEPNAKRLKMEDITLKNLLHKTKNEAKIVKEKSDSSTNEKESSRLLHLLTGDVDPVIQFKQLLADDINIPDPLLVPKNRLNQILMAPGVEIPRLLTERPELRLPDALAFPQLLQNPDILVISIAQLQIILQKHSETIKLHETPVQKPEKVQKTAATPVVQKPIEIHEKSVPTPSTDMLAAQYAAAKSAAAMLPPHIAAAGLFDSHMKSTSLTKSTKENNANSRLTTAGLAGDIDAATTAAFNQMLWLPYLNQLEAAAVACGNNTDFLKALNAVFPPSLPPFDPTQMFPNFGMHNNFPPASMDYNNQLEMAMWQEAMMKANMAAASTPPQPTPQQTSRSKNAMDNSNYPIPKSFYRENNNNSSLNNSNSSNNLYNMDSRNSQHMLPNKKTNGQSMQSTKSSLHSSARTSPITHNFNHQSQQQQRFQPPPGTVTAAAESSANGVVPPNPYLNSLSNAYPFNHSLQIPHYNPSLSQWNAATASAATTNKQSQHHSSRTNSSSSTKSNPSVPNYQNYNNLMTSKNDYLKYQQNILNAYNQRSGKQDERKTSSKSSSKVVNESVPSQQKPRVTCKSLQNLLSPSRLSQDLTKKSSNSSEVSSIRSTLPSSTSITRLTTQPMDLSGSKHDLHHLQQMHHPMLHSSSAGGHHAHHQQHQHHHSSSGGSKLKVKQHLVDNMRTPKLLKHDEIPEVGSTTSSLEEMSSTQLQDAQNHLWHPLFGKHYITC